MGLKAPMVCTAFESGMLEYLIAARSLTNEQKKEEKTQNGKEI